PDSPVTDLEADSIPARHMPRPFDPGDVRIEKRWSRLHDDAWPAQEIGRDAADVIYVAVGQYHDLAGAAGGCFERGAEPARSCRGWCRVERRDTGAEPPDDGAAATSRDRPRAIESRAPRCAAHTEGRIEQHDRLIAGREKPRGRWIPQQQQQREDRGHPQDHERHASASAIVNLPS